MSQLSRYERKLYVSVTLAICGFFCTLILSKFPLPMGYVCIAVANWYIYFRGIKESMKARHLIMGRYMVSSHDCNMIAIPLGLIIAGIRMYPCIGPLASCIVSGLVGHYIPNLIKWDD